MKTVTWELIFRWQDWIAFEELHRPLFREHGAIYFSNVNKPSKDMNYAFCEVCSLFSPLEWSFLQPNSPQFRDSLTHFCQPSIECVLFAVSSHPLCYLGCTQCSTPRPALYWNNKIVILLQLGCLKFPVCYEMLLLMLYFTLALINASIFAFLSFRFF